jgi:hypothetical protein
VKVHDLAWVEFQKPDLRTAERFAVGASPSCRKRWAEQA